MALALVAMSAVCCRAESSLITIHRVPDGGLQPQARVDSSGRLHLIYFKGDPAHGDVFYVHSDDGGATFSRPLRVNSQPGSVIAIGTVRGPQLAIGRANRVHVAWMGSDRAQPKADGRQTPMLYARLADSGEAFEPQRNVVRDHPGLDGGGSIAADVNGNVYVAWHAPTALGKGEADRHVWMVRSADDGKTFGSEVNLTPDPTGVCGCCGMRLFATPGGDLFALYRSATATVNRDIYLLASHDGGKTVASTRLGPWKIGICVMSTAAMASDSSGNIVAAWEQEGNIFTCGIDAHRFTAGPIASVPGLTKDRKHPAVAIDSHRDRLIAWTEGTGWAKGGSVAWQLFDASGKPIEGTAGRVEGMPAWDLPAVAAIGGGRFVLLY